MYTINRKFCAYYRCSFSPFAEKTKNPPAKGGKCKGKVISAPIEKAAPASGELEYEITHRDTGVVYCSESTFSDLSLKELRVKWRRAMG